MVLAAWPHHYSAKGTVIVGETDGSFRLAEPVDIESQVALIRSPRLIRTVLAQPGVPDAVRQDCERATSWPAGLTGVTAAACGGGVDEAIAYAARQAHVGPVGASRVVEVKYTAATPETAQSMVNLLIEAFLDEPRPNFQADREHAVARLRQEVAVIETAVREDEGKLAAARRAAAAPAPVQDKLPSTMDAAQQAMAENALIMKSYQRGIVGLPDVRAGLDARPTESVQADYNALQTRLATEAPEPELLRSLRAQREELRLRLVRDNFPGFRAANRAYLAAAAQRQPATLQLVADIRPDAPEALAPDPGPIERTLDLKRQLYVDAYRRASALEAEALPASPVNRLVNLAERPAVPNERLGPAWIASAILALGLGTIAAIARDVSDKTIRSAAAIEGTRDVTVIAQIPRVTPAGNLRARLSSTAPALPLSDTLAAGQRSPLVQDALRGLHARLVLAGMAGERRRTFLITSAAPGEGKSFTTLALAQLIATSGRRVLVVECDMRRPTFAAALNLSSGPGLVDVLRGYVPAREAVARTAILTLDAIPAGVPCTDTTELLMGARMADLMAWAKEYDFVLLDTPPSDVLMDARVLAKLVDGVVICTRWGRSKLGDLGATVDGVKASGGYVYGVAVTMVETRQHALFDSRPVPTRAYMAET